MVEETVSVPVVPRTSTVVALLAGPPAAGVAVWAACGAGVGGWSLWAWLVALVVAFSPLPVSAPSVVLSDWHDWVETFGGARRWRHWPVLLCSPAGPAAAASLAGWAGLLGVVMLVGPAGM